MKKSILNLFQKYSFSTKQQFKGTVRDNSKHKNFRHNSYPLNTEKDKTNKLSKI